MAKPRPSRTARPWLLALTLLLPAAVNAGVPGQPPALQPILLNVRLNGTETGDAQLLLRDEAGRLYASRAALALWRLRVPGTPGVQYDGETFYLLDSGLLKLALSMPDQSLAIDAPASLFETQNGSLSSNDDMPMTAPATGLFVNYDMFAEHSSGATSLEGAFELGLFNAHGVGSSTFVARAGSGGGSILRLDTNWTIDRPASMMSIRLGDGISGGGPGAPPVRFAGIQYARNFAVRPGFATIALPSAKGSAALPSIVDIYVNDVLQGSRQIEPGPFDISGIPLQAGGGSLRIVTRDLLGRETVTTQSYYSAAPVLRRGLHDFSWEAGFLRRDFGIRSNGYGAFMLAANDRFGLTDSITAESVFELTAKRQIAGAGISALAGRLGLLSASATFSRSNRGGGGSFALGIERSLRAFSFSLRSEYTTARFAPVGTSDLVRPPRLTTQAFFDHTFRGGSIGASYVRRDNRGTGDEGLAGVFATFGLGRFGTAQVYARRSTTGRSQTMLGAFVAVPLGGRRSASASIDYAGHGGTNANVSFQDDPPISEGSGYRVTASVGAASRIDAQYSLNTARASFSAQAGYGRGGGAVRLSMAGSAGLIGGQKFASRRIGSSFAAVKLDGLPNVRIYADNQLIGTTDKDGLLVVPSMRAFERNVIRLDEADLPLDVQLPATEIAVRPYARTGTIVTFAPRRERGVVLKVALEDGSDLPAGAMVYADRAATGFVTASGGEVYVPNLSGTARLQAIWGRHSCTIEVIVPDNDDPQPRIDGLVCRKQGNYANR